jgi:hypothetical protein
MMGCPSRKTHRADESQVLNALAERLLRMPGTSADRSVSGIIQFNFALRAKMARTPST